MFTVGGGNLDDFSTFLYDLYFLQFSTLNK